MSKIFFFTAFWAVSVVAFSCYQKKTDSVKTLSFSIAEEIPVPEPSGLDLSYDEKSFWIVSDQNSKVYLLDSWGNKIKSFKVKGDDLEGITVVNDSILAVVLERSREVVILDTAGNELKRTKLDLKGDLNSGLEGITYNPADKKYYLLNEKKPTLLITLDENLVELARDTLNISKDVSGIFYDDIDSTLWILSDESHRIYNTDLSGNQIDEFKIIVAQPEGITFNKARTKLYLVSDKTETLYVFNLDE
jgi:uncharacterized protein YjiK